MNTNSDLVHLLFPQKRAYLKHFLISYMKCLDCMECLSVQREQNVQDFIRFARAQLCYDNMSKSYSFHTNTNSQQTNTCAFCFETDRHTPQTQTHKSICTIPCSSHVFSPIFSEPHSFTRIEKVNASVLCTWHCKDNQLFFFCLYLHPISLACSS